MSLQEHGEKILREFGLTSAQARVFLALVRLGGKSTVREISHYSSIVRQDVYGALAELQDRGLVEEIFGNPAGFRAIPLQEALAILSERRRQKTNTLMAETAQLLDECAGKEMDSDDHEDNGHIVLIPKRDALIHRTQEATESAEKSVSIFTPWGEMTQWVFLNFELMKKAFARGVEFRWMTGKPPRAYSCPEALQELLKEPKFKVAITDNPFNERFSIIDEREVFIATLAKTNAADSPALWTNNVAMVHILDDYFEMMWKQAKAFKVKANFPEKEMVQRS